MKIICQVEVCDRPVHAKGYCVQHYRRMRKGQDLTTPIRMPKGWIDDWGYRRIYVNSHPLYLNDERVLQGKRVSRPEHCIVMEEALERRLYENETVHHINGNKLDNRLENLELWASDQPPGQRVEDLISFAKEILARYEPFEDGLDLSNLSKGW